MTHVESNDRMNDGSLPTKNANSFALNETRLDELLEIWYLSPSRLSDYARLLPKKCMSPNHLLKILEQLHLTPFDSTRLNSTLQPQPELL